MKWNDVEKNWNTMSSKFKSKWNKLSDQELEKIGGDRDQLQKKLKKHYDMKSSEANRQIDDFVSNLSEKDHKGDKSSKK